LYTKNINYKTTIVTASSNHSKAELRGGMAGHQAKALNGEEAASKS
jgi:hypothetical protein